MPGKGLSREALIDEAVRMIEEVGFDRFSLRELAARLSVQPASLYNHVQGIGELTAAAAQIAGERLRSALENACAGREPDDAFLEAALAYRRFAAENPELYRVLIHSRSSPDESTARVGLECFAPFVELIRSYGVRPADAIHFGRALRAAMHGFAELSANGFMMLGDVPRDETYLVMIRTYLNNLKGLPKA